MSHDGGVDVGAHGVAEGEIVYGVEEVCLSFSVVADEAIEFWREGQRSLGDVFVVEYGYGAEFHYVLYGCVCFYGNCYRSKRSGRRRFVRSSACSISHSFIFASWPESSMSGTRHPL